MKVLIIEDDRNYALTLRMFVDDLGYEIAGVARNSKEAIDLFKEQAPDLALMDIHLEGSGLTGIDLAQMFQESNPTPIIFITSLEDPETFNKAKETVPFAYLIKPFKPDELQRSMELALQHAHSNSESVLESNEGMVLAGSAFFVRERNKLVKVLLEDVLWIEVEGKYCIFHTDGRKYVLRQSLKELSEKLDPVIFVQTHRSFIVNAKYIDDIDMSLYVVNIKGHEVPLGRAYRDDFLKRLEMF